jgi:hypothetical protein
MTEAIKAIETRYKGYRFRSRLKARWAVFFDALGIPYQYEHEGYALPSGYYLPDFLLDAPGWVPLPWNGPNPLWAEVKPGRVVWPDDFRRPWELSASEGVPVWVIAGNPWPDEHWIYPLKAPHCQAPMREEQPYRYNCLTECSKCEGYCLLNDPDLFNGNGTAGYVCVGRHSCRDDQHPNYPTVPSPNHGKGIHNAYLAARAARFEHGESPGH